MYIKYFTDWYHIVPNQAYLPLCIIVRMIAGCGSACIVVCGMSILLKATSYSNSTIIVSITQSYWVYHNHSEYNTIILSISQS